jgi:hypothetical protein
MMYGVGALEKKFTFKKATHSIKLRLSKIAT